MKRIFALRHAKAESGHSDQSDFERGLAPVGEEAASAVGKWLTQHKYRPELVLASPSKRTAATYKLLCTGMGQELHVEWPEKLYLASAGDLFHQLQQLPNDIHEVMIIGHNPGLQQLTVLLAAANEKREDAELHFPTATLAILDADITDWNALKPNGATLTHFITSSLS